MQDNEKQAIVFGYYHNNELKGFRADTFGTLSMTSPKIYHYSQEQVDIILRNTKSTLNKAATSFMKMLLGKPEVVAMNIEGQELNHESIIDRVSDNEDEVRSWGEFEVRVHPFIDYEDSWTYPERWKVDVELKNLKPAIEVHKFKTLEYEN